MISQYLTASIKIIQFSIPPPTLSIYVQNFSILLTLDVLFQMKPPLSKWYQSIKRKHNLRMAIICYQVLPSGRLSFSVSTRSFLQVDFRFLYQLINLVWLSFDFFSFSWCLTICFFVALHSCMRSCPKILRNIFYL